LATVVVVGLGLVSLVSIGEELSWGQRLIGFTTPEIASQNRQGELTLHYDARIESSTHLVLLLAGLYGVLAPLIIRRSTSLVPPRTLSAFFAVIAVYYSVRLVFLDAPGYVEAKYSEWPETCFSLALLLWCAHVCDVGRFRGVEGCTRAREKAWDVQQEAPKAGSGVAAGRRQLEMALPDGERGPQGD
jgi:hypothetical protein